MRFVFSLLFLISVINSYAQVATGVHNVPHAQNRRAKRDTVIESDTTKENKEPQYFYVTVSTTAYVNTIGTFAKRFVPSLEFGRTYGIFDLGIATGTTNSVSSGSDTTHYLELRPTINIFSKGRFAQGLCLGAGYVFGAKQALMTEICNSINFNITENSAIAIVQGYEFFDGSNSSVNRQYVGFTYTYNFLKDHSTNKRRKRQALLNDN